MVISLLLLSHIGAAAQNDLPFPSSLDPEYSAIPIPNPFPASGLHATFPVAPLPKPIPFEFALSDAQLSSSPYAPFGHLNGSYTPSPGVNHLRIPGYGSDYMPLYVGGKHSLGLTGSRQAYPSMGFSNSLSFGYGYSPTDGITLYIGVYASDNMYHHSRFKNFGVSEKIRIQVADWLYLNGYGNYSLYNSASSGQLPLGMYPTTSYGRSIEVKVADHFGLEGRAQRGFNVFTRQWETSYYIMPVFYYAVKYLEPAQTSG